MILQKQERTFQKSQSIKIQNTNQTEQNWSSKQQQHIDFYEYSFCCEGKTNGYIYLFEDETKVHTWVLDYKINARLKSAFIGQVLW